MLMNLRNAMVGGGKLPYLCELEYIESTGTQWIDTGVVPRAGYGMRCKFAVVNTELVEESNGIIGIVKGDFAAESFCLASYSDGYTTRYYMLVGLGNTSYVDDSIDQNHVYVAELNYLNNNQMVFDGVVKATIPQSEILDCDVFTRPIAIASIMMQPEGGVTGYGTHKIYEVAISNGQNVIRNYKPVLDLNGEPKLFDVITGTYPAHYGVFIAGPRKE